MGLNITQEDRILISKSAGSLLINKKSFIDSVFGRTKMVAYGTILYTTFLLICSAGLLFLQYKSKIRQRPALKLQGHKVKSKLPSGKKGKKKQKSRSK
jgi:hypothetical protein